MNSERLTQGKVYAGDAGGIMGVFMVQYTSRTHTKSSGDASRAFRYPFSACDRGARTMSDHTPTQQQTQEIPYGYCQCGCGQLAPIAKKKNTQRGHVKGEPIRYVAGHNCSVPDRPLADRFWEKVAIGAPDDCWLWTASVNRSGYGLFNTYEKGVRPRHCALAHRVAYELSRGEILGDLCVLHNCPNGDNPACCNPAHLWLGTRPENTADMVNKGRLLIGENVPSAKLTTKDVIEIRALREAGFMCRDLAIMYDVTAGAISDIARRVNWKHVK